jgi:sugar lactone lactonase YvrE
MKKLLFVGALACFAAGAPLAAQSVPELKYTANADIVTLPALGEVAGVATNSKGHMFAYVRTGQPVATLGTERTFYHGNARLFEFDGSGKFVREIGRGTYAFDYAEQVRVDPQDNIWVVDAGANMATKFDPEGRLVIVLGRKPENIPVRPGSGIPARGIDPAPPAGAPGEGGLGGGSTPGAGQRGEAFNQPTDIAFDKDGNIYVADGMAGNNRIAKFNRDGDWVNGWGHTGSGQGEFNKIMGIGIDNAGNVYVADAGNRRIQVFDGNGTFKSQITGVGTPHAICMSSGTTQYIFSSNSNDPESMDNGEIYKVALNGTVVGKFGKAGRLPGQFGMVNGLDCRDPNTLWVAEVWNWRVQKVTLAR